MIGAILADGTKIHKMKIRGLGSYGMLLGKTDAEIGTDLTHEFCHPDYTPELTARHVKWPIIELLHNVVLAMGERRKHLGKEFIPPTISYRAKVKLHGINGAVQIVGGDVVAQSRKCILDGSEKKAGFFRWVQANRELLLSKTIPGKHLTLLGEWCGPGVQKGMAVSKINRKVFAVFGAQIGLDQDAVMEVRPEKLRELVPKHPDVFVLPWYPMEETLDFGLGDGLTEPVARMNKYVEAVEKEDPWVLETFEVSGTGEGLVWYPDPEGELPWYCPYHEMMFKTKGKKHSVVRQKKPVQVEPEVVKSIEEFVDVFVTEPRLEQILTEVFGDELPTRKGTGDFLKAFGKDVEKESKAELEAAGLEWKQVSKAVMGKARAWFFGRM
jgi:hypothetical protein